MSQASATAQQVVRDHLEGISCRPPLTAVQQASYKEQIKALLIRENAVLVAHYYTDPLIQQLAEETGGCVADSLEMARFGPPLP